MKIKRTIRTFFIAYFFIVSNNCDAQIGIPIGITYANAFSNQYVNAAGNNPNILLLGLSTWHRKFIAPSANICLSVPFTIMIGLPRDSFNSNDQGIGIDLPAMLDYNIGLGSKKFAVHTNQKIGAFVGVGLGLMYANVRGDSWLAVTTPNNPPPLSRISGFTFGPMAHAGIRFKVQNKTFAIRTFYRYGLEKTNYQTVGLGTFIVL
jgi:hypothetical protein